MKDVEVAVAVAGKSDPLSVRRKTWIDVARFVHRQALNVLAVLVCCPDVAEITENDPTGMIMRIAHLPRFAAERKREGAKN